LLEFANLMLDVLLGFLALYFVDVVHATPAQAGMAVAAWTGVGLLGDLLLIPSLERLPGLAYLRVSALLEFGLYIAFLLLPGWGGKLVPLALLGFFNSGWYAILQARLYQAMPGKSGAAVAVSSISGLAGSLMPLALGWVAERYNLQVTMWLLLLGPVALLLGLPRPLGRASAERD
jgi:MFS transporter, FSR family, fosmidomycin resistance protein